MKLNYKEQKSLSRSRWCNNEDHHNQRWQIRGNNSIMIAVPAATPSYRDLTLALESLYSGICVGWVQAALLLWRAICRDALALHCLEYRILLAYCLCNVDL